MAILSYTIEFDDIDGNRGIPVTYIEYEKTDLTTIAQAYKEGLENDFSPLSEVDVICVTVGLTKADKPYEYKEDWDCVLTMDEAFNLIQEFTNGYLATFSDWIGVSRYADKLFISKELEGIIYEEYLDYLIRTVDTF